ncbi:hypothetical protein F0L68_40970 [Solihabitans fulvus]|uniref:Uncharacterized protein n=1 Tax=Solihabitans fulvus TaxID=1892852 RepID=A0A5B2W6D7_9PSEU|nr:hypothetical protein [Solihabitans fulvus]KAA2245937.1 hypothetical protein F0L68_40970 [Solihabitans fulvus]
MWVDLAHTATALLAAPPPTGGGGPDFSNIGPDSSGVPKTGVILTLAKVMLFIGLGICFLVLLGGVIVWVSGHMAGGMHLSQNAKTNILRAGVGGIALTSAGAIWTWITSVS